MFKIMSDATLPVARQVDEILALGCELFGEEIGIVSRIEGNHYAVKNVYPRDGIIKCNNVFDLQNTFCQITFQANGPMGTNDVRNSPWKAHPCIETGLESYIGVPIIVNGERYGTLNFSSPKPKASQFSALDHELIDTLGQWIGTIIQRSQMISQLQTETVQDDLTDLMNRRGILDVLEQCAKRSSEKSHSFTILFIDLDKFKSVNDTFGHNVGDQLLQHVARRLENIKRPSDAIGRLGGDEFLAVLEDVPIEQAHQIADRIADSLEAPFMLDGNELRISASIGIATGTGENDIEALIEMADAAMYKAKRKGERIGI